MKPSFLMFIFMLCATLCVSDSYLSATTTSPVGGAKSILSSLFPSFFPPSSNPADFKGFEGVEMVQLPYDEEVDVESTQAEGECFGCQLMSLLPNLVELIKNQISLLQDGIESIQSGVQEWTFWNTQKSSSNKQKSAAAKSWIHPSQRLPIHFWIIQAVQIPFTIGFQPSPKTFIVASATLMVTLALNQPIQLVWDSLFETPATPKITSMMSHIASPSLVDTQRVDVLKYAKALKVEQAANALKIQQDTSAILFSNLSNRSLNSTEENNVTVMSTCIASSYSNQSISPALKNDSLNTNAPSTVKVVAAPLSVSSSKSQKEELIKVFRFGQHEIIVHLPPNFERDMKALQASFDSLMRVQRICFLGIMVPLILILSIGRLCYEFIASKLK